MRNKKPDGYRPILSVINNKTPKGEKFGWLTGIMYGAPADTSGFQTCSSSTAECRAACLRYSGHLEYKHSINAGLEKTRLMFNNPDLFDNCLEWDIEALKRRAAKLGLKPAVRINGTTDLPRVAMDFADRFRDVQFYDYTKHPKPWRRTEDNYHITFSYTGENDADALAALDHGINVAKVFPTRRSGVLPTETVIGDTVFSVIDGDETDLRFLDINPVVVGLRIKAKTRKYLKEDSNFVRIK